MSATSRPYRSHPAFRQTASANLQAASTTQVIGHALLSKWGPEGLRAHTARVAGFYRAKRDVFAAAMTRHLTGLAEWSVPEAGMFFWFVATRPLRTSC